jgi:hypothetical protein
MAFCARNRIDITGALIESTQFFAGVEMLLKILREKMRSHHTAFDTRDGHVSDAHETLRSSPALAQVCLFEQMLDILEQWPDELWRIAKASTMSQAAFARYGSAPAWLDEHIQRLPARLRPHYAYQGATLVKRVREIEAGGGRDCRERRARELVYAARKWS